MSVIRCVGLSKKRKICRELGLDQSTWW